MPLVHFRAIFLVGKAGIARLASILFRDDLDLKLWYSENVNKGAVIEAGHIVAVSV